MLKKTLAVLGVLTVFLAIVIMMAPAKTVLPLIQDKLPKQAQSIQFGQVEGTIWAPKISDIRYGNYNVQDINLDISPLSLLVGDLDLAMDVADPRQALKGELTANRDGVNLRNIEHSLDAAQLNPFMEFPVKGLSGKLDGNMKSAQFNQDSSWNNIAGSGTWFDAVVYYFDTQLAIGDIKYVIQTDETNSINLKIIENEGPLDLEGDFILSPDKTYQLNFSTRQQLPENLAAWIKRLGKLENNRYRILWKGKLK